MLVEKSAFEVNPSAPAEPQPSTAKPKAKTAKGHAKNNQLTKGGAKLGHKHGVCHSQKQGSHTGAYDTVGSDIPEDPSFTEDAPNKGLYLFIQTMLCCQQVLTQIFGNTPSSRLFNILLYYFF